MNVDVMQQFMRGALVMGCFVAGLFFTRFYRQSGDRLFVFFTIAFLSLAVHWGGLAIADPEAETRHYLFLLRLLAFLSIIAGILDKNRRSRAG